MNKILLKTSGRTGSHLILDYFEFIGHKVMFTANTAPITLYEYGITEQLVSITNTIVQCHLKEMPKDTHKWDLIFNKRHDLICQTLSSIIARQTNVWHVDAKAEQFKVEESFVKQELIKHMAYNTYMDLVCKHVEWKSVTVIEMEDIITNPRNIPRLLGKDDVYKSSWEHLNHKKAMGYRDAIANYDEVIIMIKESKTSDKELATAYGLVDYDMRFGGKYGA